MATPQSADELLLAIRLLIDSGGQVEKVIEMDKQLKKLGVTAKFTKKELAGLYSKNQGAGLVSVSEGIKQANQELKKIPQGAKKAGQGLLSFSNIVRTAFGTLTAIGIFQLLTAITTFFQNVFQKAQEMRGELLELNLAESILSQKGMDITRKDFDDLIDYIRGRYTGLSELDATKIVAETATSVQEFDVNAEQFKGLTDAIAFVQTKNKLLGKEAVDAGHIMNALMDARSNFFNGMGINITNQLILEKAYAMGLLKTGEAMSKEIRFQASLALFMEQTSSKQDELNKSLEDTPLGRQIKLQEEWDDTMLAVGNSLITVRDNLIDLVAGFSPEAGEAVVQIFSDISKELNRFIDAIQKAQESWTTLSESIEGTNLDSFLSWIGNIVKNLMDILFPFEILLATLQSLGAVLATLIAPLVTFFAVMANGGTLMQALKLAGWSAGEAFVSGMTTALETLLKGENGVIAQAIKKFWLEQFGKSLEGLNKTEKNILSDTPTTPKTDGEGEISEEQQNLEKALEKMNNEILEQQIKLAQDMEDAQIDLGRKLVDIATEYAKKRADAERDYANDVSDIQADYSKEISDIQADQAEDRQKARNDELQREAEFQNEMQELKENFLMDLEEALHSRDARAILRLTKQYALDKLQAERQRELERQNSQREQAESSANFQRRRKEAEEERKAKLAEAHRDYQQKLAQLKAEEIAEREKAEEESKRKIEDLEREMQNRLEIVGANLIAEFNLTKTGLDAILSLYQRYYAEIAGIYQAMTTMLSGQQNLNISTSPPKSGGGGGGNKLMAEGGTIVANKPTQVTFGEAGLEQATFTPLGRTGNNVNKTFSNMDGGGMGGGLVEVLLTLSPDLQARIVKETMGQTANILTKINRSKS